ncbi:hypothetical protein ACWGNN_44815 [Streptomyces sp. NPDC055817]
MSFGTHYLADRRVPGHGALEKLAVKTGKESFYRLTDFGMNGAFHLDIQPMRLLGDPATSIEQVASVATF